MMLKMGKGKWIATSLLVAFLGSGTGMLLSTRTANASILVYDQENILQAMKTAVNTASILTAEQKQLALQVLNMTSISAESLAKLLASQATSKKAILDEGGAKTGALNENSSTSTYWNNTFSDLDSVLNGNMTVIDAYSANEKAIKAMEKTNQDALHGAKTTQALQSNLTGTINSALSASSNASGIKEALQANTQTVAAQAFGTLYGNSLLSEVIATNASKHQKELQDEATSLALNKSIATQAQSDVDDMKSALGVSD